MNVSVYFSSYSIQSKICTDSIDIICSMINGTFCAILGIKVKCLNAFLIKYCVADLFYVHGCMMHIIIIICRNGKANYEVISLWHPWVNEQIVFTILLIRKSFLLTQICANGCIHTSMSAFIPQLLMFSSIVIVYIISMMQTDTKQNKEKFL